MADDVGSRLREFLYVDVQRVRSLLSQMKGGLVEQIKSLKSDTVLGEAQAKMFGVGGRGAYSHDWTSEESRSLQDMTFALFEDEGDVEGWIVDAPDEIYTSAAWESGSVHALISPAQIVRVRADIQLLDGGLFRSRLERFTKMTDALLAINPPVVRGPSGPKQKGEALAKARREIMGDTDAKQIEGIVAFIESLLGDSIAMRVLPCGRKHLEYAFNGALLGRREYIQEEREHLFSRYGTYLNNWTTVLQVSSVPTEADRVSDLTSTDWLLPSGDLSRARTELSAAELLSMMEGIGLLDGPRWPTISVTPLGVYRDVPPIPST